MLSHLTASGQRLKFVPKASTFERGDEGRGTSLPAHEGDTVMKDAMPPPREGEAEVPQPIIDPPCCAMIEADCENMVSAEQLQWMMTIGHNLSCFQGKNDISFPQDQWGTNSSTCQPKQWKGMVSHEWNSERMTFARDSTIGWVCGRKAHTSCWYSTQ